MSAPDQHHALTPGRERATLLTLGAVQFTHVLDFMIMMPLGAQLMDVFHITPAQFTHLVAAYGLSAAIFGFAGGFVLEADRGQYPGQPALYQITADGRYAT